jgi:nucleoside phosphorylase
VPAAAIGVRIDFAIITVVNVEREAVCDAFGLTASDRVRKGSRVYWRGTLPLPTGESYQLAVAQSPDVANVDAALLASDLLHHWSPSAVLVVGIAGAASDEVRLGDIVLARDIYYYERGKETPDGTLPEPVMYRADAALWSNVTSLPDSAIPHIERPDGTRKPPRVHEGVIASGERVIADATMRDRIKAGHRKILAIEMEGYGVSAAVWQSFDRCRHLVIRAICDSADRNKDDDWQPYAAAVAAGFARSFLLWSLSVRCWTGSNRSSRPSARSPTRPPPPTPRPSPTPAPCRPDRACCSRATPTSPAAPAR